MSAFTKDLDRRPANFLPLSPVSFLPRAARIYGARIAVIHGARRYTYAQFLERSRRLASALARAGIGKGDAVAIMAPNIPEMLEAHNAVPMLGAVLCCDQCPARCRRGGVHPASIPKPRWCSSIASFRRSWRVRLAQAGRKLLVVDIDDRAAVGGERTGSDGL